MLKSILIRQSVVSGMYSAQVVFSYKFIIKCIVGSSIPSLFAE